MKRYLLPIFLLLTVVCHSQDRKYFTKFKPTKYVYGFPTFDCYYLVGKPQDSLKIELNILQAKVVDGMECISFQLKYNGDKVVFWIGIKDSVIYTFKRNKLKKPVKVYDFRQDEKEIKDVPFYPFAEKNVVLEYVENEGDRVIKIYDSQFNGLMVGGLKFHFFYISLERGLFFDVKSPNYELTYTNLEEL